MCPRRISSSDRIIVGVVGDRLTAAALAAADLTRVRATCLGGGRGLYGVPCRARLRRHAGVRITVVVALAVVAVERPLFFGFEEDVRIGARCRHDGLLGVGQMDLVSGHLRGRERHERVLDAEQPGIDLSPRRPLGPAIEKDVAERSDLLAGAVPDRRAA